MTETELRKLVEAVRCGRLPRRLIVERSDWHGHVTVPKG